MSDTPPYEGRRESADVDSADEAVRGGARVGGATGPLAGDDAPDAVPESTGSPADEQPAADMPETDLDDDRVGPAHEPGTRRGEKQV
jgi:hypothetical protein